MDVEQFVADITAPMYRYRMARGMVGYGTTDSTTPQQRSAHTRMANAERDIIAVVAKHALELEETSAVHNSGNEQRQESPGNRDADIEAIQDRGVGDPSHEQA